ncbi:type II toxin-antitoxin system RelE/ParE family toxin [Pedobacter sp. SD-b]|uniref:Type II toxin-antitoxin system RelE/ParE family toxin n=1 Tax=Pedobacter segetis TaxID=2793069 RepID=A0ABS1BG43_9SPHI|nr:type II toxin-antitoxin system RelE/ParE family toxin [Pedobacter segetis]MBK0381790.1 type II toxin-antitoxin system RelE/ParE family toxin [Pedobacter segetis]
MKSGYSIKWTSHALKELEQTISYLQENFSDKEINKLALKIEKTLNLIEQNPFIFPKTDFLNTYKVIVLKYNTLYFRVLNHDIQILSFFSNRQSIEKTKL